MWITRRKLLKYFSLAAVSEGILRNHAFAETSNTSAKPSDTLPGEGKVTIEWLGHGSFKFMSPKGITILLDPWISTNPKIPSKYRNYKGLDSNLILFTHGHYDHFMLPDLKELVKQFNPDIITTHELQFFVKNKIPSAKCLMFELANIGGRHDYHGIHITMVEANHSSSTQIEGETFYTGEAVGYIMEFENGLKIYHAGDTALMSSMKDIIGDFYRPDVAILPIGGAFTMEPRDAAYACTMIRPAYVIPEHYGTFPALEQKPDRFMEYMKEYAPQTKVLPMKPGEEIRL